MKIRLVPACLLTGTALVLGFELYCACVASALRTPARPVALGNDDRVIGRIAPPDPRVGLSFAVMGDIHEGFVTLEAALQRLKTEKPDFLVLLGDSFTPPPREEPAYFRREFAETGFAQPTLLIIGNHDLDPATFSLADFERIYGPANFAFVRGECLFIGLGRMMDTVDKEKKGAETLAFMDAALKKYRDTVKFCFVFVHYPPHISDAFPYERFPGQERFLELVDRYRVSYVISGHYHRFLEARKGETTYVISGGGGGRLRQVELGDAGRFRHMVLFSVNKDVITEKVILLPRGWCETLIEKTEFLVTFEFVPFLQRHLAAVILANLAGLGLVFLLWRRRGGRRSRGGESESRT